MNRIILILLLIATVCLGSVSAQAVTYNFTTFDYPGAIQTYAFGIDGVNIVGYYEDAGGVNHGFLFDGTTYTSLDYPGASQTLAYGIDGGNISGYFNVSNSAHGFVFDGTTYTSLDYPGANHTLAYGIDGGNIVGYYQDAGFSFHGFVFDGTTYTSFDYPGAFQTYAYGIDGGNIVGQYQVGNRHGFLFDGTNYISLDYPGADASLAAGIDGGNIVGFHIDATGGTHGFLFDGTNYISLDYPGADDTYASGIDGGNIVGYYIDATGVAHGFFAIPMTPSQQIDNILSFYGSSASTGTLVGSGPGNSAKGRLKVLKNMLEAADQFMNAGDTADACQQLMDAYNRTDGLPKPPDFVAGQAASELAAMIQSLRMDLGCH